jgi:hypothetical protein
MALDVTRKRVLCCAMPRRHRYRKPKHIRRIIWISQFSPSLQSNNILWRIIPQFHCVVVYCYGMRFWQTHKQSTKQISSNSIDVTCAITQYTTRCYGSFWNFFYIFSLLWLRTIFNNITMLWTEKLKGQWPTRWVLVKEGWEERDYK